MESKIRFFSILGWFEMLIYYAEGGSCLSAEKRDSVVGISRNLTDALMAQIDSGVIIPTEESALQWNSMLDYAPNRNDISDMREDV